MARRTGAGLDLGALDRLRLGWRLLRDPRVSAWKWLVPALAAIVVCSPQSFIPLIGQIDDVGVIGLALLVVAFLACWAPAAIVREHAVALGLERDDTEPFGDSRARRPQAREEPIEAEYWVDDWR